MFGLLAAGLYTAASASSSRIFARGGADRPAASAPAPAAAPNRRAERRAAAASATVAGLLPTLLLPQAGGEAITTYESDCVTPGSLFELGDTVCVRVSGAHLGADGNAARRVNWVARTGSVVQSNAVTNDPQTFSFTLPSSETTLVTDEGGGTVTVDNRGVWKVFIADASESSFRTGATFTVRAPTPYVDLQVSQSATVQGGAVSAGSSSIFEIFVTNAGPNDAANVVVSDAVPANATYVSMSESTGLGFACSATAGGGSPGCTLASMPSGSAARIVFAYSVSEGAASGSVLTNGVSVSSSTAELEPGNNSSSFSSKVPSAGSGQTCSLSCREDMTVAADTTQDGQPGAVVSFGAANGVGNCGAIIASPASGTFLPVGEHVVSVSSETGGGVCSFIVTVVGTPAPAITCPEDKTATASPNGTATVNVGQPTTSDPAAHVEGVRSDGEPLNDPYKTGETTITWTVLDSAGRTASCTQKVTVVAGGCPGDTTAPTIQAPANIEVGTGAATGGACSVVLTDAQLGQVTTSDDCNAAVTVTSNGPDGNNFPVGTTTVTYTATDAAGNQATATQTVTVVDDTKPLISAPADAAYTCLSEVPAPDPSQAYGVAPNDELPNGSPVFDNCGAPQVTVTDASTGAGSAASPLVITRTFRATDSAGNFSTAVQTITVIDATAPTVGAPADLTLECASGIPAADASQATAADNCAPPAVTVTETNNGGAGSAASPLVVTRTYTATDAAGNSASDTQTITVADMTAPTLSVPADIVVGNDAASCSAGVSFAVTAADNCGPAGVVTSHPSGSVFPKGTTTVTATATDAAGNTTVKTFTVTVNDTEAPTISYPAGGVTVQLPPNSAATSTAVNYAVTAADNCGVPSLNVTPASGSVFNVGTTTVTATATDAAGNTTTRQFTVTVLYNFTGFFSPVANLPSLNSVNAGRAIPVKFSLSGNKGLNIFAAGSPASQPISCSTTAPISDLEGTVTSGGSSLSYSASSDQYHDNWKTEGSWAGTCRALVVTLNDGSTHTALFKFK
ncbi:MAG TPA: PxKF domain-containing protein [Pyrinomonadaceae bacterium]